MFVPHSLIPYVFVIFSLLAVVLARPNHPLGNILVTFSKFLTLMAESAHAFATEYNNVYSEDPEVSDDHKKEKGN